MTAHRILGLTLILGAPIMFGACAATSATTQSANAPSVLRPSDVVGELEPTRAVIASTKSPVDFARSTASPTRDVRAPDRVATHEDASEPVGGGRAGIASHGLERIIRVHEPIPCGSCR